MHIFALFDKKGNVFLDPVPIRDLITARRMIADVLKNPDSLLAKYPEDFSLFDIGEFDQRTGNFCVLSKIVISDFRESPAREAREPERA